MTNSKRRRKIQKRVIKRIKKAFPLATTPLDNKGKKLTNL